jgi:deoxycytidine triphosphate deaminase
MPLSGQAAVDLGLVHDPTGANEGIRDASYDLHVGYVIINGKVYDPAKLEDRMAEVPPQHTFTIISREVLKIENGFVGYAFLKTTVARKGILAINTGIIDAGWHNHLATTAINFHKEPFLIFQEKSFLRIAFERVENQAKPEKMQVFNAHEAEKYLERQLIALRGFPSTFLDIPGQQEKIVQKAKMEIVEEGWRKVGYTVTLVTMIALVLAGVIPVFTTMAASYFQDVRTEGTTSEIRSLQERMRVLEERLKRQSAPGGDRARTTTKESSDQRG